MGFTRESVETLLQKHLPAKKAEKEAFGEVFTPPSMIEDLLDQFPSSLWKDSAARWLDPAAGIGNFPIFLFFRYMDGLKQEISNETKRAKHIIEKILYMVEINKKNTATLKNIFQDLCPTATPNLYEGDFFSIANITGVHHAKWPTHYTAIIGNPPYNVGGTKRQGVKRAHIKFTELGLHALEPKGFLAFICPPNYRETGSKMNLLFQHTKGHFTFIKMYDWNATFKLFRIQALVDAFIYQVGTTEGSTKIIDTYNVEHTVDIDLTQHIPNFGFSIFKKLKQKVDVLGHPAASRTAEMTSTNLAKMPCGDNKLLHLIISKGKRIYSVNKKHTLQGTPKILVNGLGIPYVYYDKSGQYGVSPVPIVIQRPSNALVSLFEGPLFNFIAWGLRITGNNNLPYIIDAVPNVKTGEYNTIASIKDFLHLTADETKFLDAHFSNPTYEQKDLIEPCGQSKETKTRKAKSSARGKTRRARTSHNDEKIETAAGT